MPPKSKNSVRWKPEHAAALQKGFREYNWDPEEKNGRTICTIIRSVPEIFSILQPFFGTSYGGTKANNNPIYLHYKSQGSEFITLLAKGGIRRSRLLAFLTSGNDAAFLTAISFFSFFRGIC
jgi:hypothetical protein